MKLKKKKNELKERKMGRTEKKIGRIKVTRQRREKNQVILTIDELAMKFNSRDMYDYVTIYPFEMLTNVLPHANEIILRKTSNPIDN